MAREARLHFHFVLDTSVLIHLERGHANLHPPNLPLRFESPRAVVTEFCRGLRVQRNFTGIFPWLVSVSDPDLSIPVKESLGPGEQTAIRHCEGNSRNRVFVSDDRVARSVAGNLGLAFADSSALFSMFYAKGLTTASQYVGHLRQLFQLPSPPRL